MANSLPGMSGSVQQNINADVGAGAKADAMQKMGQTGFDVAAIVTEKRDDVQLMESLYAASEDMSGIFAKLETNQDEDTYDDIVGNGFTKVQLLT